MGNEVIFIVSVIALIFYLVISKFLKNSIKDNYFRIFIGLIISIMFGIIFYVFSVAGLIYFLIYNLHIYYNHRTQIPNQ